MPGYDSKDILKKLDEVKTEKDVQALLNKVDYMLQTHPAETELLHARARLHVMMQQYGKAINDYHAILEIDKKDKVAVTQIEQLKTILRYNNTDIYASPNTNFDPWME